MDAAKQFVFAYREIIGDEELSPDTISLHAFNRFNKQVQDFIAGSDNLEATKSARIEIEKGSYKLVVALLPMFVAPVERDVQLLQRGAGLDGLNPKRAEIVVGWQSQVKEGNEAYITISSAEGKSEPVVISASSDYRTRDADKWVEVEEYEVGTIVDMGGASKVNVHIRLPDRPILVAATSESYLKAQQENYLYRKVQVRLSAEKNIQSGDYRNWRLISIIGDAPSYDEEELRATIRKGTVAWADVPDAVAWVREQRGG